MEKVPLENKKPSSNVFCGSLFVHRMNPVFEIKNLLKQVAKPLFNAF